MQVAVVYEDGSFASKARDEEQNNGAGSKGKYLERINQQSEDWLTGKVQRSWEELKPEYVLWINTGMKALLRENSVWNEQLMCRGDLVSTVTVDVCSIQIKLISMKPSDLLF